MAARRTRIKGIANIPQRRKVEKESIIENDIVPNLIVPDAASAPAVSNEKQETTSTDLTYERDSKDVQSSPDALQPAAAYITQPINERVKENSNTDEPQITDTADITQPINETVKENSNTDVPKTTNAKETIAAVPFKRRFAKPILSTNLINRKPKPKIEDVQTHIETSTPETETQVESTGNTKKDSSSKSVHFALNETEISDSGIVEHTNKFSEDSTSFAGLNLLPRSTNTESIKSGSDTEYPPAPPSPTKFSRTRIKAVPRFGQRRTSFSASESEDDNRKTYIRQRNDSVCSAASDHQSNLEPPSSPKKELHVVIQRKWKRTEQSRKLAEARRDFLEKFGDSKPDRQKLTMMDLIFYNPTTNPMSQKRKRSVNSETEKEQDTESKQQEAAPIESDAAQTSDEENAVPAPQIKISADGEIVIDEQSLVIENKEVKKSREQIQKSSLVDGDFDTGYGVYKKVKRSKDWSKKDTLHFYKALNTIGTDFSLMCELFPNRTRKELKMKFKKEERMNRALVDRAVMQPSKFDIMALKHEMEMEEREVLEREKMKREVAQKKANTVKSKDRVIKKPVNNYTRKKPTKRKPPSIHKDLNEGITSLLSDSDADESDVSSSNSSSESSDSVIRIVEPQPTRSGRIPKPRQPIPELLPPARRPYARKTQQGAEAATKQLEPGSVVIFTSTGPSGEPVYKVFMVTPGQNKTPLNLNQAVLEDLTKSVSNADSPVVNAQNILTIAAAGISEVAEQEPLVSEENNVTIPASEDITMRPAVVSDHDYYEQTSVECSDMSTRVTTDTQET